MVCAPSNTAVDEIVYRLKTHGVIGSDGRRRNMMVVRVGQVGSSSSSLSLSIYIYTISTRMLMILTQVSYLLFHEYIRLVDMAVV